MVSSNKERSAPKSAQRYKDMEMTINKAMITKSFKEEMIRMVEFLCDTTFQDAANVIQAQFSHTGSGMLRAVILDNMWFTEAFPLVDFLDKETKAAEVVARMIREEVTKNS